VELRTLIRKTTAAFHAAFVDDGFLPYPVDPGFPRRFGPIFFFLTKSSKPWFPSLEKSASQKDTLKRLGCGGVVGFQVMKGQKTTR